MKIYRLYFIFLFPVFIYSCKQGTTTKPSTSATYSLEHLIRPAEPSSSKSPCIIFLHGLGSNEKDLFRIANQVPASYVSVSVRGPYAFHNMENKYSWYPLQLRGGDYMYDFDKARDSKNRLVKFAKELVLHNNVDPEQIYIGGFSQGGVMSLYTSLTTQGVFAGAISFSGYLPPEAKTEILETKLDKSLRIFASHGTADKKVPFERGKKTVDFIDSLHVDITFAQDPSRHTISQPNFSEFMKWLQE